MAAPPLLPIKLHHPATQVIEALGSVGRVIVTAERLILDDQEVAIYGNGCWVFKGQAFTTVSIDARAGVHFEDENGKESTTYGPFDRLQVVDRALRQGDAFKQILAHFDAQAKHWELYGEPGDWLKVVIRPA
jgi:hypothetical protein